MLTWIRFFTFNTYVLNYYYLPGCLLLVLRLRNYQRTSNKKHLIIISNLKLITPSGNHDSSHVGRAHDERSTDIGRAVTKGQGNHTKKMMSIRKSVLIVTIFVVLPSPFFQPIPRAPRLRLDQCVCSKRPFHLYISFIIIHFCLFHIRLTGRKSVKCVIAQKKQNKTFRIEKRVVWEKIPN